MPGASILPKPMMHILPYLKKLAFPPISAKFTFFASYFDHDAFMLHALHVLDVHE